MKTNTKGKKQGKKVGLLYCGGFYCCEPGVGVFYCGWFINAILTLYYEIMFLDSYLKYILYKIRRDVGCIRSYSVDMCFFNLLDVDNFEFLTWSDPDFIEDSK